MIRVLFLSANPIDTPQLEVIKEYNEIYDRLRATRFRDKFELIQRHAISVRDLTQVLLEHEPEIVHFSGHGSEQGALIFQDDEGKTHEVPPPALTEVFRVVNKDKKMHCVFLNACYAENQAKAISQNVDCVIGMSKAITDTAAREFAVYFYQVIGFGRSIQDAFDLAKAQLMLFKIPEEGIPRLKYSPETDPAKVILIQTQEGNELPLPPRKPKELPKIKDVINNLNQQFNQVLNGEHSIEDFSDGLLRSISQMISDPQNKEKIGHNNVSSLNLLRINLSSLLADYRRERDIGDDNAVKTFRNKVMLVCSQIIDRLRSLSD